MKHVWHGAVGDPTDALGSKGFMKHQTRFCKNHSCKSAFPARCRGGRPPKAEIDRREEEWQKRHGKKRKNTTKR
jgi:hypothetical protein